VFGPQTYHRLPELLARAARRTRWSRPTSPRTSSSICRRRSAKRRPARGVTAFLTVQEGCDKFCTFCVVPYTRGAEVSRPLAQVWPRPKRLADAGVREITLLGQNVNAYHGRWPRRRAWGSASSAHRLAEIEGLAASATRPAIRATWTTS
jgi:tRNA-2-methylthio-N6-dimethylallyladenosine synthase